VVAASKKTIRKTIRKPLMRTARLCNYAETVLGYAALAPR
jgi:hypothetical protein